ncbi:MAG: T9SS type A sorting domain-containing protein [bacterium]
MKLIIGSLFAVLGLSASLFIQSTSYAQGSIQSKYIKAIVGKNNGIATVLPLYDPSSNKAFQGRLGLDPQLDFYEKSFFTCQIGSQFYTNNGVVPSFPSNAHHLNSDGVLTIIQDATNSSDPCDTARTVWSNKSGVDIIQDVYCIDFTKSGQVVMSWKFKNTTTLPITVSCQYLNDIQISDPTDPGSPNSNDGPKLLTKWEYTNRTVQYPNNTYKSVPSFYAGFLHDIPYAPSLNPGLGALGFMEYGQPLNLIKPFRITNGDWYVLASNIFGPGSQSIGTAVGTDNGILLEFSPQSIPRGKTIEVGRTSYGTGEYERCVGNLFSLVFYPHHLTWTPKGASGSFDANPIHIEKFVVNPSLTAASSNTLITLTVGKHLDITTDSCKTILGKKDTLPTAPSSGDFIAPNGVKYYDWYACVTPPQFCNGPVYDTLKFTAKCSVCPPAFVNQIGNDMGYDECEMVVQIDCAESDNQGPQYSDSVSAMSVIDTMKYINVHDWLVTDKGLRSITWKAFSGFDSTNFIISLSPPVSPCYNDKRNHVITILQKDSTKSGSYQFTFTDCLGNVTKMTENIQARQIAYPDTIPPMYVIQLDSIHTGRWLVAVTDAHDHDRGIDSFKVASDSNFILPPITFDKCAQYVGLGFSVSDTLKNAILCLHSVDCAGNKHDTCIVYTAPPPSGVGIPAGSVFTLEAITPNPFSHLTTIRFSVDHQEQTKFVVFDILGKQVTTILDESVSAGIHSIDFDGSRLEQGIYILRMESAGKIISRKVVIER